MAIYHCSIKIFSRGKGASVVAKATYRAGELLHCEYDGKTHDYTRKGGVVHTEILLPENAPTAYADRSVLWNAVEKSERYKTAQLAREIEIGLPAELTQEQNIALTRNYVKDIFVRAGMCADVCIHDKGDGNPHAHIMLTMRPIEKGGAWGQKSHTVNGKKIPTVDWNEHDRAEDWRKAWAAYCNTALHIHGHADRVDHRSYERQGIEQVPTVHLGVAAHRMEKRGIHTDRGDINREAEVTNKQIRQLRARISKLRDWLKTEIENTPPTFAETINAILVKRQGQGRYKQIADLKFAAKTLNFITENSIQSIEDLRAKVGGFYTRQSEINGKLKKTERRIETLDEHIKECGILKEYRGHMTKYRKLYSEHEKLRDSSGLLAKHKAQKALAVAEDYYESQRAPLTLYEAAERYIKAALNGKTTRIPLEDWKAERVNLEGEKKSLYQQYYTLKGDVKQVEDIRRYVEDLVREESRERLPIKAQEIGL